MKWMLLFVLFAGTSVNAQQTGLLENQKDAWGVTYTYTGEIKNGKPNGMGVARYISGKALRYVGQFADGMYSGKGTILFSDGTFVTGNWVKGEQNGKGAYLNASGVLYIGDMKKGNRHGEGTQIYKDNSFVKGSFVNGKIEGRCINVWKEGKIISDVVYANDLRNGNGYQYEATTKKLYEGEWKDDKWVQAAAAPFSSFFTRPAFISEITEKHVLIGATLANGQLKDTAYYYDLRKNKRYFGLYERGIMRNGVIIDDSTRFLGKVDEKGAYGYCYDFKFGSYFTEGNYVDDLVSGSIVDINLKTKGVYMGEALKGRYTGKAYYFTDSYMYSGTYIDGKFTGDGYRIDKNGTSLRGDWDNGAMTKLTTITLKDGSVIPPTPKTFAAALNLVAENYLNFFDVVSGALLERAISYMGAPDVDTYKSLISFPGSNGKDVVAMDLDYDNFYVSTFMETDNGNKAKEKYNELAKLIQQTTIRNHKIPAGVKLVGTVQPVDLSQTITSSEFKIEGNDAYRYFKVWLEIRKDSSGNYAVLVRIGEEG